MLNLYRLTLGDLFTLAVGIAIGNGLSLFVFIELGLSTLPAESGLIPTLVSYAAVVVLLTLLPVVMVFVLIFISSRISA